MKLAHLAIRLCIKERETFTRRVSVSQSIFISFFLSNFDVTLTFNSIDNGVGIEDVILTAFELYF